MVKTVKNLRCCCSRLYRAVSVRYGIMMLLLVVSLLTMAQPAAAQNGVSGVTCIRETVGGNPSCTANDVRIGKFTAIGDPPACDPNSNDPITVTLEATIESGPTRYDVGIWINQEGGSAQSDTSGDDLNCYRDYLAPPLSSTTCEPDGPYYDADGNACGDVYAVGTDPCGTAVVAPCTGGGGGTCLFTTYQFTVTILCRDQNNDGTADVGSCTSWKQNAGACTGVLETDPGTGSKCNCGITNIIGLRTGCIDNSDCDDQIDCTTDTCSVDANGHGTCNNTTDDSACDDGNVCTDDTCNAQTGCVNTAVDGRACGDATDDVCNNPDTCDANGACQDNFEPTTTECRADAGVCDVAENCDGAGSCPGDGFEPDGTACDNTTVCDGREVCASGSCNAGSPLSCSDGNACNGVETCDPVSGCVNGTPVNCEDGDSCTVDTCDPATGACSNVGSCPTDTQITPTATTCQDFRDDTAADLNELLYGTKGGAINSISPGVFFVYDGLTLGSTCTITVTQTDGSFPVIGVHQGQVVLYDALSCGRVNVGSVSIVNGDVTISNVPQGNYILGIKYDPTTLKGFAAGGSSATYTFAVSACGAPSGSDTINVNPKP